MAGTQLDVPGTPGQNARTIVSGGEPCGAEQADDGQARGDHGDAQTVHAILQMVQ